MLVALAQIGSNQGDFEGTVAHMLAFAQRAARLGAGLVVYPATTLSGAYPMSVAENATHMLDLFAAVNEFARATPIPAAVPAYINDGERGYVEVFACMEGLACPLRRRNEVDEELDAPLASAPVVMQVGEVDVCFAMPDQVLMMHDVPSDLVVFSNPMGFCDQDASSLGVRGLAHSAYLGAVADLPCRVAMVSGVGAYDDLVFAGGSYAVAPGGRIVAACANFEEDLCTFDVPATTVDTLVRAESVEVARAGEFVGLTVDQVPTLGPEARTAMLYRALEMSVRNYVHKSGFSDVVVGLSGGIDSALVAAIAADALGPEHVHGILMPGPYSSEGSVSDALDLAGALGMATSTAPIAQMFDAACSVYEASFGEPLTGIARENLQARIRGMLLMTHANARGALVLNTTNKSESGMGYSTLYGDTVGAYAPLCDVYKGRVYELARWRNAHPSAVIPSATLEKPPSAELSDNQTDESSLGMPYELIDRILFMHVERGMDAASIAATGIEPALVLKVTDACRKSEFKRRQEPMGPIVSTLPFVDRVWPVVLGWRDHVDDVAHASARPFDDDAAEAVEADRLLAVSDELDAMLMRASRSDQVVSMIGDFAFGTSVSGVGPELDGFLGMPFFSKN